MSFVALGQTTYTWSGGGSGSWNTASNWTPTRTSPAVNDIIVFNTSAVVTLDYTSPQTIGQLQITGNSYVVFTQSAVHTLNIGAGLAGDDFTIDAGSALVDSASTAVTTAVLTGNTGSISGMFRVRGVTGSSAVAHTLSVADAAGLTVLSGGVIKQDTLSSGSMLGTSGTAGVVVFAAGSKFDQNAGSNIFGLSQPSSKATFQAGSWWRYGVFNGSPAGSGRTYANLEIDAGAGSIGSSTGGSVLTVDTLKVTSGTYNLGMTGTAIANPIIRGSISVASGATLNFSPASGTAYVSLNGGLSVVQTITGSGTITTNTGAAKENFTVNNANGVLLGRDLNIAGTLTLTSGNITTGANKLIIASTGSLSRTSGQIVGNLQKAVATGSPSITFEIGDATDYRPINLSFTNVTKAGNVTAAVSQTAGDHPQISTSLIDPSKSVNRYWTMSNDTATFDSYSATFNFIAGDVDGAANTSAFLVQRYNGSNWVSTTTGTQAATSTQATGLTAFGDFAIGDQTTNPLITVTGGPLAFGDVFVTSHSAEQTYTVSGINLTADISITAAAPFEISTTSGSGFGGAVSLTQTAGVVNTTTIYARFSPSSIGSATSKIVNASTGADTQWVNTSGNGVQAGFLASQTSFSFGNVWKDSTVTDTVTVTNASTSASLVIDSVRSNNSLYTVSPSSGTIGISSSSKFAIAFNPTAAGASSANIVFYHNAPSHRDTVKVSGNGIVKVPGFAATPTSINFGAVIVGQWKMDSVTVKNTGYDSLIISSASVGGDTNFIVSPSSARLDTMATQKFYVTFKSYFAQNMYQLLRFVDNTSEGADTVFLKAKGLNIVTIAEARKDVNSDGIADHSVSLDTLAIAGIITTPNMGLSASQTSYFMQDGTGGIDAFAFGLTTTNYLEGDSVVVIGTVAQYRGLVEFSPLVLNDTYFKDIAHKSIPAPKHLTLHQFVTIAENYEGQLIEIDTLYRAKGYWPGPGVGNVSVYLTNASRADTAQMFLDLDAHVGGYSDTSTYPINVKGTVSQFSSAATVYNNGYEISPRDSNDISRTRIAPTVTIAEARKDANGDLIADHSVSLDTLTIYGVVTTPNMGASASQTSYFIQDATAGVDVFFFGLTSTAYARGDSVMVTGTVAQYRGLVEFTPLVLDDAHFMILKHNAKMPTAKRLTLHQFVQSAESYEGQLIEIDTLYKASGTWPATAANASVYLTNSSKADTAQMFLDLDAHIGGTHEPTYPLNVVGIVSQFTSSATVYNNGYEISPRDTADYVHTPGTATVEDQFSGIPKNFELYNSYPNPFNPSTTIEYGLPQQSKVTLKVYSVLGQEIATLVDDIQNASYHHVQWNGRDSYGAQVSSGVYFFRIVAQPLDGKASPFMQVRKMMLMK